MQSNLHGFMSGKKRLVVPLLCLILVLAVMPAVNAETAASSFDLNSLLLKVSLTSGDSATKVLSISRGIGQQISLEVVNVPGVTVSESSFVLQNQETKNLVVKFDSKKISPKVYAGSIKISDSKSVVYLPIIFEVESQDVFYDTNLDVPPAYSSIQPGEKLVAQIKVFDLTSGGVTQGLGANTVNIDYVIFGIDGKVISSESESAVVDKQTQLTKTVSFPNTIAEGQYVIAVIAKYKSSVGTSSYLFSIQRQKTSFNFFGAEGTDWKFFAILGIIVIIFFGIIFFFVYLIKDRDSLLLELRKYNDSEFKNQRAFVLEQQKILRKKGVPAKRVKKEVQKKLRVIKARHKDRLKIVKKLQKEGDVESLNKQLGKWKKEGYNTLGLEYKLKPLSRAEMEKSLARWKQEYKGGEGYKKK